MDLKRGVGLLLACLLLLALFAGCRRTPAEKQTEPPRQSEPTEPPVTDPTAEPTEPVTEPVTDPDPVDVPTDADVHPMLFHVTGENGQECWLFGTIHAGDERIGQVLTQMESVLDICDALAVEFDIVAYEQDYDAQMDQMMSFALLDGTTVDQHMPPELFARASALLQEAGLMPELMKMFNLAMWSQLMEQAALITRSDLDIEIGIDRELIGYCYEHNIEVRDVESAELQYNLLLSFPDELNLLLIEQTLDGLDTYGEELNELYEAWLRGNYDEITALLQAEDEEAAEKYTDEERALIEDYNYKMLPERNLGMRDKAVEWLEAGDKVFFAVGAAHLCGEEGLVELLRAAGYTVEQVEY